MVRTVPALARAVAAYTVPMNEPLDIGVIGLGVMGQRMLERLQGSSAIEFRLGVGRRRRGRAACGAEDPRLQAANGARA